MRLLHLLALALALCSVGATRYPRRLYLEDNVPYAREDRLMQFRELPAGAEEAGAEAPAAVAAATPAVERPVIVATQPAPAAGGVVLPPEPASVAEAEASQGVVEPSRHATGVVVTADTSAEALDPELSPAEKAEFERLDQALGALKEDIMRKVAQVQEETKWVEEVRKVLETYEVKTRRVESNIHRLREEVKKLYHKKKQVENLKLQKQLELKLKDAKGDLQTLETALSHIKGKADEFDQKKSSVLDEISSLQTQMAKLQGLHNKAKAAAAEEAEADE